MIMHPALALANPFEPAALPPCASKTAAAVFAHADAAADFSIQSSDGGTGVQPFALAEAAREVPAPRNISGKQEGRTGMEVGTSQTPGSPMLSARTLPTPERQASLPSEAYQPPAGYVLVRKELLETLHDALLQVKARERSKHVDDLLHPLPSFLSKPEFKRAMERA
jgi:hypothetical protein